MADEQDNGRTLRDEAAMNAASYGPNPTHASSKKQAHHGAAAKPAVEKPFIIEHLASASEAKAEAASPPAKPRAGLQLSQATISLLQDAAIADETAKATASMGTKINYSPDTEHHEVGCKPVPIRIIPCTTGLPSGRGGKS